MISQGTEAAESNEVFLARFTDIESRMAFGNKDILFLRRAEFERLLAIAAGTGTAKTRNGAECAASQSGRAGASPKTPPTPPHHSLGE